MYKMVSARKKNLLLWSMNYSTVWTDYANPSERIDKPRELITNKRKQIANPRERIDKPRELITN